MILALLILGIAAGLLTIFGFAYVTYQEMDESTGLKRILKIVLAVSIALILVYFMGRA